MKHTRIGLFTQEPSFFARLQESLERQTSLPFSVTLLPFEQDVQVDVILLHGASLSTWKSAAFSVTPSLVVTEAGEEDVLAWCKEEGVSHISAENEEEMWQEIAGQVPRTKNKTKWLWIGTFLTVLVCLVSLFIAQGDTQPKTSSKATSSATQKPASPVSIAVVGSVDLWNALQKNSSVEATLWKREEIGHVSIPADTRFILLPVADYTADEKMLFRSWIEKRHVVMLYGTPLAQQDIASFFGPAVEVYDVQSTGKFEYVLYGYGYSKKEKQDMPYFLMLSQGAADAPAQIATFLASYQEK